MNKDNETGVNYEELRLRLVRLVLTYGADDIDVSAALGTGLIVGGFIRSSRSKTWHVTDLGHKLLSGELNHE